MCLDGGGKSGGTCESGESCRMFPELWLIGWDPCEIAHWLAMVVYKLAPAITFFVFISPWLPQWLLLIDSDWQLHIQIRVLQHSMRVSLYTLCILLAKRGQGAHLV